MAIKAVLASTLNYLGFLDVYGLLRRKLTKSQVAILVYHRISPRMDNWSTRALNPETFERQIEYLTKDYETLSLESLSQYLQQEKSLPAKAAVITLDDGYKDNYLYAYPILKKYHIPATTFLTTGYINTGELFWWNKINYAIHNTRLSILELKELGRYSLQSELDRFHASSIITEMLKKLPEERRNSLIKNLLSISCIDIPADLGKEFILSWDEIKEMSNDGIAFGAHSVNHPILTNLSLEQAKWEIIQSKRDIEERIGKAVTAFSYPNGDFNADIAKFIRESGFTSAVTTIPGLITSKAKLHELRRIGASENFNMFKVMLSGLYPDLRDILSRAKSKR